MSIRSVGEAEGDGGDDGLFFSQNVAADGLADGCLAAASGCGCVGTVGGEGVRSRTAASIPSMKVTTASSETPAKADSSVSIRLTSLACVGLHCMPLQAASRQATAVRPGAEGQFRECSVAARAAKVSA